MTADFDLQRALRRIKPEKRQKLRRRQDGDLIFAEDEKLSGGPLLLDTSVYLHTLRGSIPPSVNSLLRTRPLLHTAVALSELTNWFGARIPRNAAERAALGKLARAIRDIPPHRVTSPGSTAWGEAGIIAGVRARMAHSAIDQQGLNDALIFLQAQALGATVLTANVADFDILQQIVPNGRVVFYRTV